MVQFRPRIGCEVCHDNEEGVVWSRRRCAAERRLIVWLGPGLDTPRPRLSVPLDLPLKRLRTKILLPVPRIYPQRCWIIVTVWTQTESRVRLCSAPGDMWTHGGELVLLLALSCIEHTGSAPQARDCARACPARTVFSEHETCACLMRVVCTQMPHAAGRI